MPMFLFRTRVIVLSDILIKTSFYSRNIKTKSPGMELSSVVKKLELFASPLLAESWDNVGLLLEPSGGHVVKKLFLINDLTEPVMEEALQKSIDLIISYHPPLFKSTKRLTQLAWKDRLVVKCLENRVAIYSPHTSFDIIKGGVNDWLLSCFHGDIKPIVMKDEEKGDGIGRICNLSNRLSYEEVINKVKHHLGLEHLRIGYPMHSTSETVSSIACCAGSGASVLNGVQADVYLTGELSHHEILDSVSNNRLVILCEHSNTERGFLKVFSSQLNELLDDQVEVILSQKDKDPITII